jgi:ABC-2 type transport system ATP-binding protein
MIKVERLTKQFPGSGGEEFTAVSDLSLSVRPGQIFGFLGPNGAGKTTTIRMLTSLLVPSSGTAHINGLQVGYQDQAIRQSVGLLSDNPGFYDMLSAEDNLTFFARLYGVKKPRQQAQRFLQWLDLWNRHGDAVGTFSKGMRQKLGLARAAMHAPRVLFLDEPTSGLDPDIAKQMRDFMVAMKNEGRTIFLCTHNLDEADRLCDCVGVFKHHLVAMDSPTNLRRHLFGRESVFCLNRLAGQWTQLARQLPFVAEVRAEENRLLVRLENPEENNPIIIRKLVEAGADIQFVTEVNHTLEEVYLRLLEKRGAAF